MPVKIQRMKNSHRKEMSTYIVIIDIKQVIICDQCKPVVDVNYKIKRNEILHLT